MKARIFVITGVLAVLALLLSGAATAQEPRPPLWDNSTGVVPTPLLEPEFGKPTFRPAGPEVGIQSVGATAGITLGQPGLSFRYVQTFGVTREPFIETNDHFYGVEGLGVDGNYIWLTDSWGNRVLKFDNAGTFQQKIGKAGVVDYTGTSLDYITDVAVDSSGNIWVVDASAAHVVEYNSSGQRVKELGQRWNAGSGNDQFNDPISIAFDGAGNIYVSDSGLWDNYGNHRVQVFDSSGSYITTIGQTGVCGSLNSQLCWPRHIAVYGDRLYVADTGNHRVQIFDITNPASPSYVATLGVSGVSGSDNSHFDQPEGVGVDASYIYVADSNNNRVQIFNRNTLAYVATIGGSYGQGDYQFNHPTDVVIDASGNIYVADNYNRRVQQFSSSSVYQRTYGTTGVAYVTDGYHYYFPFGVAVAQDGSIYIVEERAHRLVKLNAAGAPLWTIGEPGQNGSDNSHFFGPQDVAVDGNGRVYTVENWGNHRIQIFNSDGSYYATLGQGWGVGNYNFKNPSGIAIDAAGNIYVADSGNHRVQIYNSQFAYVATLGATGVPGSDNAHFNNPNDVAVDGNGTIYVADEGNDRVQVFDSNRQYVRTIGGGGTGNDFGHFDGWGPHHLAVDSQGRLYVVDSGNSRVQVFDNFANGNAYLTTIGGAGGTQTSRFSNVMGIAVGPDDSVYTSEIFNNHRIQKFAPGVPGWKQVNINGFGEPDDGANTLAVFNNQLYAGGSQIWRTSDGTNWTVAAIDPVGPDASVDSFAVFDGLFYLGTANYYQGAGIYRSSDGVSWTNVITAGWGLTTNIEIINMAVYSDHLYAATLNFDTGGQIWRSSNGITWTQVVSDNFGSGYTAWWAFEEFDGQLYAGLSGDTGGLLYRTDGNSWTPVTTDGFGDTNNEAITSLAAFKGYLYAGTRNMNDGAQVWRSNSGNPGSWNKVATGGFGNPKNGRGYGLVVAGDYLYFIITNTEMGDQVYRTTDGLNWEHVGIDGWGDSNNIFFDYSDKGAAVFKEHLYITGWGAAGGKIWKRTVTADFTATPTVGTPGTVVTFTNLSGGDVVTATWNFGDGSTPLVSNTATVTHTYTVPGVYTVTLTVEDGVDTDVRTRSAYIRIAHFTYLPLVMRAYNPLMALYDDFNNPAFDGFYNPVKWQFWGDSDYFNMRQQGGEMILTSTNAPAERDTVMVASAPLERTLQQVQRFQARLKISPDTNGTGAKIQIMGEDIGAVGRYWWASCDLTKYGSEAYLGCSIASSTGYEYHQGGPAQVDRWYTMRIEVDPNTARFCFYQDDSLLGCHTPNDAAALKVASNFTARIGAWNEEANPSGTLYFDDVYITPAR